MNTRYNLVLGTALVAAAALPRPCAAVAFESAETGARRAAPEAKRVGKALAAQGLPSMPYRPREETALAAAKFCDVVSQNIYFPLPVPRHGDEPGFPDCPILVGEFHFQLRGRGYFNSWNGWTPEERIVAYREYVEHALRNPRFVGAHWFQWADQPLTGRGVVGPAPQHRGERLFDRALHLRRRRRRHADGALLRCARRPLALPDDEGGHCRQPGDIPLRGAVESTRMDEGRRPPTTAAACSPRGTSASPTTDSRSPGRLHAADSLMSILTRANSFQAPSTGCLGTSDLS